MAAPVLEKPSKRKQTVHALLASLRAGDVTGNRYLAILGLAATETPQLIDKINEGLSYRAWERFAEVTGLATETIARVVRIPLRTLGRRKDEGRLHPEESDRLVRLARVFVQALGLFDGELVPARQWLTSPQPALHGAAPLDYAASEVGAREVESLIGRLEQGIPS